MCGIRSAVQGPGLIGTAKTLHEARDIARKNDGSEFIRHEKDGSYSVEKLADSEKNQVKQKPGAKFNASVVEFSIEDQGKEQIFTNKNASAKNKVISKSVTVGEKTNDGIQYVEDKTKEGVKYVKDKTKQGLEYVEDKAQKGIQKVKNFVHKGLEFISPLTNFASNPFYQRDAKMRSYQSNCGPASGAIIAESFLPGISKNNNNFILDVRDASGGPQSGALTEGQVIKGVAKVTKGKVQGKIIDNDYRPNNAKEMERLVKDIKTELGKGNLLMLCTGFGVPKPSDPTPSRHYITIVGIDNKGNLLVSDPYKPAKGTPPDVWSPDKLRERMNRAAKTENGNSSLVSFAKK